MQYLYLIKCQNYYKIGIANDVESRMAQLSTGNPYQLELHSVFSYANALPVEAALHQRFSERRMRGEWFNLKDEDLGDFEKICTLLGGVASAIDEPSENDIENAEETFEPADGARWDFAAMFSDGWRMEKQNGNNGWNWRKGSYENRKTIYGGTLTNLPHDVETMRRIYRDGEKS